MSEKINLDTSLGDFVAQYPQSRELFNSFGLDYCCGGNANLIMAAKSKNIDLNEFELLLQSIVERVPNTDKYKSWQNESLTNIVNHILQVHHSFAWEKLASIEILLDKLIEVHGEKHGDFLQKLKDIFVEFRAKLEKHLKTEENVVFPYVLKLDESLSSHSEPLYLDSNITRETIGRLQKEHEEAGESLSNIKKFTTNYELPDYACASFAKLYYDLEALEDDLHAHIHLENTVLFPRVMEYVE